MRRCLSQTRYLVNFGVKLGQVEVDFPCSAVHVDVKCGMSDQGGVSDSI
jgi:hypothetical protein